MGHMHDRRSGQRSTKPKKTGEEEKDEDLILQENVELEAPRDKVLQEQTRKVGAHIVDFDELKGLIAIDLAGVCEIRKSRIESDTHHRRGRPTRILWRCQHRDSEPQDGETTILFNRIVSTPGAKFISLDISNIYLNTALKGFQYMRFHIDVISEEGIEEYELRSKVDENGMGLR